MVRRGWRSCIVPRLPPGRVSVKRGFLGRRSVFFVERGAKSGKSGKNAPEKCSKPLESLSFFLAIENGKKRQAKARKTAIFQEKH